MDPLYTNLDKRNSSANQPKTQAPQPTAYSMPNFGQTNASSTIPAEPTALSSEPIKPITSSPELAKPIVSSSELNRPITPTQPIISTPPQPTTSEPLVSGSGDIILNINQPKKKTPKLPILLLSIVVVFCLTLVTIFMLNNNSPSTNQPSQNESLLKTKELFNNYANYIIYGKYDSVENLDLEKILENYNLYNPSIIYGENFTSNELQLLKEKFLAFYESYNNQATIDDIQTYFYDYKINFVDEASLDDEAFFEMIELRRNAMEALVTTYCDIYKAEYSISSEAKNE